MDTTTQTEIDNDDDAQPSAEQLAQLAALKAEALTKRAALYAKAKEATAAIRALMREIATDEEGVHLAYEAVCEMRSELGVEEDADDFFDIGVTLDHRVEGEPGGEQGEGLDRHRGRKLRTTWTQR